MYYLENNALFVKVEDEHGNPYYQNVGVSATERTVTNRTPDGIISTSTARDFTVIPGTVRKPVLENYLACELVEVVAKFHIDNTHSLDILSE